jgi:hypothetical protein
MATIAECVARGAALLDEHEPGWWQRIDLDRLNIASCEDCTLGQLHGDFTDGLAALYLTAADEPEDHGFMWYWSGRNADEADEAENLTAAWRTLIEERRAGEPRA